MKKIMVLMLITSSVYSQAQFAGNSYVRWSLMDSVSVGNNCHVSGNGRYCLTGWSVNDQKVSFYDSTGSVPLWEYNASMNYSALSENGEIAALASANDIYLLDKNNGAVLIDFNTSAIFPNTNNSGPLDISSTGDYIIASAVSGDTSRLFLFSKDNTGYIWQHGIPQIICGVKLSGNDSIVIINTYSKFYVYETYTGQFRFSGTIAGAENTMGTSGDGSVIASIDLDGWLKVYHWTGTTYSLLWQRMEPPTQDYNWMTSVDISYDGTMIAGGTLNFPSSTTYEGKVLLFKTFDGSTPVWTYSGFGSKVTSVSFSKNGKILAAASWGDINDTDNDLVIFNILNNTNVPVFGINSQGSLFCCAASDDGTTVLASGKAVHAQVYGMGGWMYNIAVDTSSASSGINSNSNTGFAGQCYPNPVESKTTVSFKLSEKSFVSANLYDSDGNCIASLFNTVLDAGLHNAKFDFENFAQGCYFCKIITRNQSQTIKIVHNNN